MNSSCLHDVRRFADLDLGGVDQGQYLFEMIFTRLARFDGRPAVVTENETDLVGLGACDQTDRAEGEDGQIALAFAAWRRREQVRAGVRHQEELLRLLGHIPADDELGAARGRSPVDIPHIVADDVLAQIDEIVAAAELQ